MLNESIIALTVIELLVMLAVGFYTIHICANKKITVFIAFVLSLFVLLLGYLIELTASALDGVVVGLKIQGLGGAYVSVMAVLIVVEFFDLKLPRAARAILLAVPVVPVIVLWLSGPQGIFYTDVAFSAETGVSSVAVTPGLWAYVYYGIIIAGFLASFAVTLIGFFRTSRSRRRYVIMMVIATFIPLCCVIAYYGGLKAGNLFYPIFSSFPSIILFFICLLRVNPFMGLSHTTEQALEAVTDAVILVDDEQRMLRCNRAFDRMFPWIMNQKALQKLQSIKGWPAELNDMRRFIAKETVTSFPVTIGDQTRYYKCTIRRIRERATFEGWSILIRDETEVRALSEELQSIASIDRATGTYSRDAFYDKAHEFAESIEAGGEQTVIIVDVDRLRAINSNFGYKAGDFIMKSVADSIKSIADPKYPLARFGGKEFVMMLDNRKEDALDLARRIKNEVSYSVYDYRGTPLRCSVSVGIARMSTKSQSLDDLIKLASESLLVAKSKGGNRVEIAR